jgi:hypothetical protein
MLSETKLKKVRNNRLSQYRGQGETFFIYVTAEKQDGKGENYGIKDGK